MALRPPSTLQASEISRGNVINVIVTDDHRFMRELISARLAREHGRYRVAAEVSDAQETLRVCSELAPDLLILDINLPDRSGLDIVPEVRRLSQKTRILLCTAFGFEDPVEACIRSGAHGFVPKTNTWNEFITAVERVSSGGRYFSSNATLQPISGRSLVVEKAITKREKQILTLIAGGDTSKDIARKLHLSALTVDTHRANLMRKLGVRKVTGLVVYAVRSGFYPPQNRL